MAFVREPKNKTLPATENLVKLFKGAFEKIFQIDFAIRGKDPEVPFITQAAQEKDVKKSSYLSSLTIPPPPPPLRSSSRTTSSSSSQSVSYVSFEASLLPPSADQRYSVLEVQLQHENGISGEEALAEHMKGFGTLSVINQNTSVFGDVVQNLNILQRWYVEGAHFCSYVATRVMDKSKDTKRSHFGGSTEPTLFSKALSVIEASSYIGRVLVIFVPTTKVSLTLTVSYAFPYLFVYGGGGKPQLSHYRAMFVELKDHQTVVEYNHGLERDPSSMLNSRTLQNVVDEFIDHYFNNRLRTRVEISSFTRPIMIAGSVDVQKLSRDTSPPRFHHFHMDMYAFMYSVLRDLTSVGLEDSHSYMPSNKGVRFPKHSIHVMFDPDAGVPSVHTSSGAIFVKLAEVSKLRTNDQEELLKERLVHAYCELLAPHMYSTELGFLKKQMWSRIQLASLKLSQRTKTSESVFETFLTAIDQTESGNDGIETSPESNKIGLIASYVLSEYSKQMSDATSLGSMALDISLILKLVREADDVNNAHKLDSSSQLSTTNNNDLLRQRITDLLYGELQRRQNYQERRRIAAKPLATRMFDIAITSNTQYRDRLPSRPLTEERDPLVQANTSSRFRTRPYIPPPHHESAYQIANMNL